MKEKQNGRKGNSGLPVVMSLAGIIRFFSFLFILTALLAGCEEYKIPYNNEESFTNSDLPLVTGISQVTPANLSENIPVDQVLVVTFDPVTDATVIASSTLTLNSGTTNVTSSKSVSGAKVIFIPDTDMLENADYTAVLRTSEKSESGTLQVHEYSWKFKTSKGHNGPDPAIVEVSPADGATGVPATSLVTVTFNRNLKESFRDIIKIELTNGTTGVPGALTYSKAIATFKPADNLAENTTYTVSVSAGGNDDDDDDMGEDNSSVLLKKWTFSTGSYEVGTDVTAPAVSSVLPANSATSVVTSSNLTINFSEAMNASTITTATILLKQGSALVPGSVTYTGTVATFVPSSALTSGTVYTATVTTGVQDVVGNALSSAYSWSFITASAPPVDNTAPTVVSVVPVSNSTSVAINASITATFSEAMTASTISAATFTLYYGTTSVAGKVSYSGNTATFIPTSALTGNTVYTATITTGAKDAAGNSLSANYTWSFTTVATVAQISFASSVVPVLNKCNTCHTHPWKTSTVASTFYTNLVNDGYINPSTPTTSKIYVKLSNGHPGGSTVTTAEVNTILNWIKEGANNN